MIATIRLEPGTAAVPFADIPLMIAAATYGQQDVREKLDEGVLSLFGADEVLHESRLLAAFRSGELTVLDAAHYPLPTNAPAARLGKAVVTVDALRQYLTRCDRALLIGDEAPEMPAQPAAAAAAANVAKPSKAVGTVLPMTKRVMVTKHKHHWPSIEADMSGANENGLNVAKAGVRGWNEDIALKWAESKGKLKSSQSQAPTAQWPQPIRMADLQPTRHGKMKMGGR